MRCSRVQHVEVIFGVEETRLAREGRLAGASRARQLQVQHFISPHLRNHNDRCYQATHREPPLNQNPSTCLRNAKEVSQMR